MLHDLTKSDGCDALKQAAEDRKGWRYSWMMSETCSTAEGYLVVATDTNFIYEVMIDYSAKV